MGHTCTSWLLFGHILVLALAQATTYKPTHAKTSRRISTSGIAWLFPYGVSGYRQERRKRYL
uniref:Secreted protein n=1 Tax=Oryza sativa subsp. japonica TaxID=39947 RepID=Q69QM3_ORYSJ|nr:hypothetical protein [Oryza sativa Japonica Group]